MRYSYLSVFAALVSLTPIAYAAEPARFWLKSWTVAALHGTASFKQEFADFVGRSIVMSEKAIDDPTYESCEEAVDYSDVRLRDSAAVWKYFGIYGWTPPQAYPALPAHVHYGWIRCGKQNYGGAIFVDRTLAFKVYEENTLLELH